ncbi:hypothetical protein GCM10007874_02110 [Labrys miyagiensis]|uniref:Uncharacterized protein n=1 Tax=Labrys miyagiensis TaxID=346912 RepID=A0ABQ6CFX7_9HYPH|nr:hypothetical protein GCM10007874_02110 [Labrys miyagiensis]
MLSIDPVADERFDRVTKGSFKIKRFKRRASLALPTPACRFTYFLTARKVKTAVKLKRALLYSVLRFDGIGKNRKDASKQRVRVKMRLRLNAFCSSDR